ncbi:hypothetical protein OF83DRAFT_1082532 [Amylostereum chailletii]|nr:hypothetical protein OF83DRAFT_1082532 [Amylostereum chailletii]
MANLLGSSIGLYTAYYLERYYRHRREINRLYHPLGGSQSSIHLPSDSEDEDGNNTGTQLLPTHISPGKASSKARTRAENLALADVWDEREEVFGLGDDTDDDVSDEETGPAAVGKGKSGKSVRWADGSGPS